MPPKLPRNDPTRGPFRETLRGRLALSPGGTLSKVRHVKTRAQPSVEEFGETIMRRDFARLAELLHDGLSYEICGIELAGAGVFDKPAILARLPRVLSLFEDGGAWITPTKVSRDGDWIIAESTAAPLRVDRQPEERSR
jgi:hypothetical protein